MSRLLQLETGDYVKVVPEGRIGMRYIVVGFKGTEPEMVELRQVGTGATRTVPLTELRYSPLS